MTKYGENRQVTDMCLPLEEILAGRDERAAVQAEMLEKQHPDHTRYQDNFICQISLNIPGYPKRLPFDFEAVEKCRSDILHAFNAVPAAEKHLVNGAGCCWIGLFKNGGISAENAKGLSVLIEEESPAGRIFDIDIITPDGTVSRNHLGIPPRKCLLCDNNAKICAKSGEHSIKELRTKTELFIRSICRII